MRMDCKNSHNLARFVYRCDGCDGIFHISLVREKFIMKLWILPSQASHLYTDVEHRKQRLAKLQHDGPVEAKAFGERKQLEADAILKDADRREAQINAQIAKDVAELKRLVGPEETS